jgi:hypothetical protein
MHPASDVVDQEFLWSGTPTSDAVVAGDSGGVLEQFDPAREVGSTPLEMEAASAPANSVVALASATTRGEDESRALGQERQDVGSGVRAQASQDEAFMLGHRHFTGHEGRSCRVTSLR